MKHFSGKKTVLFRSLLLSALLALMCLSGCQGPFDLRTVLGLELETLTVAPNEIIVDKDTPTVNFTASPAGSYLWTVISGSGGIDPVTGTYSHMGVVEYVTVQAENPSTGEYGRARIRFENGVSLLILSEVRSLFPGESSELYAFGGTGGPYFFEIPGPGNISGAAPILGSTYIAGATPGVDTISVSDGTSISTTTITVLDPGAFIPDIDYKIVNPVNFTTPVQLDTAVVADFKIENNGTIGGVTAVEYSVYVSTTPDLTGIVNHLYSATVPALAAGAEWEGITVGGGNWPDTPGTYYLVVHLTPETDVDPTNNYGASALTVMSVTYTATVVPPADTVSAGSAIGPPGLPFTIENTGSVGGTATGTWRAYLSDNATFDAGDHLIDSGSFPPVVTSGGTATITVDSGTWPVSGGPYQVILEWRSADDPATPKTAVSGQQTLIMPVTDYEIDSVGIPSGSNAGESVTGVFNVRNYGVDDTGSGFHWAAYASRNSVYDALIDVLIDEGNGSAMDGIDPAQGIPYSGLWPSIGGDWFIVVTIDTPLDLDQPLADQFTSVVKNLIMTDYEIAGLLFAPTGSPNTNLGATTRFSINEIGNVAGSQPVSYEVYASLDAVYQSGTDLLISSGTVAATTIGTGSETIALDGSGLPTYPAAKWPVMGAEYYIIININGADDGNGNNDSAVMGPVSVPVMATDTNNTGTNNFGPIPANTITTSRNLAPVLTGGVLNAGELVQVNGTTEDAGYYDTFSFVPGPDITEVRIRVDWVGVDFIDLYLWCNPPANYQWTSGSYDSGYEILAVDDLVPGKTYYLGMHFFNPATFGTPYTLKIQGYP